MADTSHEAQAFEEQDPASPRYRADLYHGKMGPDVLADYHRTAEDERLGALEDMAYEQAQRRRAILEHQPEWPARALERSDPQAPVETIDQDTARIKVDIATMIDAIHDRTWAITERGIVLGEGQDRLQTDPMGFEAPKHHPVWAEELRHERETMQRMGDIVPGKGTMLERFQAAVRQLPARDHAERQAKAQEYDYGR